MRLFLIISHLIFLSFSKTKYCTFHSYGNNANHNIVKGKKYIEYFTSIQNSFDRKSYFRDIII